MNSKKLTSLKHGKFSRAMSLLGFAANSGQKAIRYQIQSLKGNADLKESLKLELLKDQVQVLTQKLSHLKGGLMKIGQMLSVYGEYFLPKEINSILKNLQNQSQPFDWETLKTIVIKELGQENFDKLKINPEPLAAASLGQVHLAEYLIHNKKIALKIQYPNVDKAIESDIRSLKSLLNFAELFPQVSHLDHMFSEVQYMLKQELDYIYEMSWTQKYRTLLINDMRFIVPLTYPDLTTSKIIATSYEPGLAIDSIEIKSLSQERRNKIALNALDLYFKELFLWGFVQTDPHIGNYKIRIDTNSNDQNEKLDQIILYDFGAVREFTPEFLKSYRALIRSALANDTVEMEKHSIQLKFLYPNDSQELKSLFFQFCTTMVEPFQGENYNWGETDIPKRLTQMIGKILAQFKVRAPPREVIFLDRKTTGVFIFLSILDAQINAQALLQSYLDEESISH